MGAYLSAPVTEKHTEHGVLSSHTWAAGSMQGWRKEQEDAHAVTLLPTAAGAADPTMLLCLFDGHCGKEVSNYAAQHVPSLVLAHPDFGSDVGAALVGAFHGLDERLEDPKNLPEIEALKHPEKPAAEDGGDDDGAPGEGKEALISLFKKMAMLRKEQNARAAAEGRAEALAAGRDPADFDGPPAVEAGCTAVVAALRGRTLTVANSGDSRAVLCRRGEALPLSEDHKPMHPTERGRIEAAGGYVNEVGRVNGNLNLSRALGDLKYKVDKSRPRAEQIITAQPDLRTVELQPGDEFAVLACDGVWDVMTNQQLVDFVRPRLPDPARGGEPLCACIASVFDECIADDPKETQARPDHPLRCRFCARPAARRFTSVPPFAGPRRRQHDLHHPSVRRRRVVGGAAATRDAVSCILAVAFDCGCLVAGPM